MTKLRFLFGVVPAFAGIGLAAALAMPPHPDLVMRVRAIEMTVPYPMSHRAELLARGVDAPQGLDLSAKRGASGRLDDTDMRVLILLADFTDQPYQTGATYFDSLIFGNQIGKMRHYYHEVSYNEFHVLPGPGQYPSQIGWTLMPHTYAYYVNGNYGFGSYPRNAQGLVVDLVQAVDPYVNFTVYDNDGNSTVDGLMVVHTGPGAELTGSRDDIWSHAWAVPTQYVDGVAVSGYSMEPEYWQHSGDMTCGVYCHEFGHQLGLPDLYDYDYDSEGVGKFSLMAGGSWNGNLGSRPAHIEAWGKTRVGFAAATVLSAGTTGISVPASEYTPTIYRVWRGGVGTGPQYFLIENRGPYGYDAAMNGIKGLFIWHIEEASGNNDNQWYPGYTDYGHYLVALEQADGLWDLERNRNSGDGNDPYPGFADNRTFSTISVPNSMDYNFDPTDVLIHNISDDSLVMSFDLSLVPQPFVRVVEPNGGEVWPIDLNGFISVQRYVITGPAHIFLSRNGGGSWTDILTLAGAETTWTVTGPTTTQALLKAEIYGADTLRDISDNTFIIGETALTLLNPNGGETISINEPHQILWDSYGYTGLVSLFLNRDYPGGTWDTLAANASNSGSRMVRIAGPASDLCRVRISCDENPTVYDESDADFHLVQPTVTLIAPNGGETYSEGNSLNIRWTANYLETVKISLSRSGAEGPWQTLFITTPNDGEQAWVVTGPASSQCRIRVESRYDAAVVDMSDGSFTIEAVSADDRTSPVPVAFGIASIFPNPFNATTQIRFHLERPGMATLRIFDTLGREVRQFEIRAEAAGAYEVTWVPQTGSGIYFAELQQAGRRDLAKLAFIK
ncbi:MAG: M6 family metalloprotease domain-containing protein [bacterium]